MNTLAIDCTTEILSLCLQKGKSRYSLTRSEGLKHSENLMPSIDWLFQQSGMEKQELELVVCALGPGSFTGLRIGLATAKALARGTGCALVAIPSLDAYGSIHRNFEGAVLPLIDARKGRFYAALYSGGVAKTDYLDLTEEEIYQKLSDYPSVMLTGPHYPLLKNSPPIPSLSDPQPDQGMAPMLLNLGLKAFETRGADSLDIGPLYLRKSEAELSLEGRG